MMSSEVDWSWEGPQWRHVMVTVRQEVFHWGLISLLSRLVVLLMYWWRPRLHERPGSHVWRATIFDAASSLCIFAIGVSLRRDKFAFFVIRSSFAMGSRVCYLIIYFDLVSIYRNPFKPERHYCLFWIVVLASTLIHGYFCFLELKAGSPSLVGVCVAFEIVPMAVFVLISAMLNFFVRCLVHATQRSGRPASISFLAREQVMRHSRRYLMVSVIELNLGLVLVMLGTNYELEPWFWHVLVFFFCGRSTISVMGWLVINKSAVFPTWALATVHRTTPPSEIALTTISDNAQGTRQAGREVSIPKPAEDNRRENHRNLMEEIRFEMIYDVAYNIGEHALRELMANHRTQSILYPHRIVDADVDQPCAPTTFSNVPASAPGTEENGVRASSHHANSALHSSAVGLLHHSAGGIPQPGGSVDVAKPLARDYCADVFRAIRDAFGISQVRYARDFPHSLNELDSEWQQKLREAVSEGASGSFFYRVVSKRPDEVVTSQFIVKQITKPEHRTLMRILPSYAEHIASRKGRSFIQYFSCHSMPLRWRHSGQVYFVVMRNFLPVSSWLVFDLKGATANRRALAAKSLHQQTGRRGGSAYGTLRDWEWMDTAMSVDVSADDKAVLAETISADAEFLSLQGLLDYSLLLGLHRVSSKLTPGEREARISALVAAGGYVSLDRRKVYFFGIIDVLERYNLPWKAQRAALICSYALTCKWDKVDGISAMRPRDYADRFRTFIEHEVLHVAPTGCDTVSGKARSGLERWGLLWKLQRRGLVRERMEIERADFINRIEELEAKIK